MKTDLLKNTNDNLTENKSTDNFKENSLRSIIINLILTIFYVIIIILTVSIIIYIKFNTSKQKIFNQNYNYEFIKNRDINGISETLHNDKNLTQLISMEKSGEFSKAVFCIKNNDTIKIISIYEKSDILFGNNFNNIICNNLHEISIFFSKEENLFELQQMKNLNKNSIYSAEYISDGTRTKSTMYYDNKREAYHLSKYEISENSIKQKYKNYNDNGSVDDISELEISDGYVTSYIYKDYKALFNIYIESTGEKIYNDGKIQINFGNNNSEITYMASIDNSKSWERAFENSISFVGLSSGEYEIEIRELGSGNSIYIPAISVQPITEKNGNFISTSSILQLPELPTGCEITSLTMLLNYLGFEADKETLADKYLPKGKYRASDPFKFFVGDPKSKLAFGCFSDVIANTAEKYLEENNLSENIIVRNITGCSAKSLYAALDNNIPVIVWITVDLQEPEQGAVWTVFDSKKEIQWLKGEHCVLLTGYDISKKLVYANDPLKGLAVYDMELFEKRFEQMNRNAVIITTENNY